MTDYDANGIYNGPMPQTLNGWPVKATARLRGRALVIIHREHAMHPWVVASWWPELGQTWQWGHYVETWEEADAMRAAYIAQTYSGRRAPSTEARP